MCLARLINHTCPVCDTVVYQGHQRTRKCEEVKNDKPCEGLTITTSANPRDADCGYHSVGTDPSVVKMEDQPTIKAEDEPKVKVEDSPTTT